MKDLRQQHIPKNNLQKSITDFLSGKALERKSVVELFPYMLYLSVLLIFYITNTYQAESYVRKISSLERELKDLRAEYITTKSQLMFQGKQTEVQKLVESQRLIQSKDQPFVISREN